MPPGRAMSFLKPRAVERAPGAPGRIASGVRQGIARFLIAEFIIQTLPAAVIIAQPGEPVVRTPSIDPATDETRQMLQELGSAFSAEQSAHFSIVSDAAPDRVLPLRRLAESTFADVESFAKRMKLPTKPAEKKMIVLFFDAWESYEKYAERTGFRASEWVPGFFDQHTGRCIMFNYANSSLMRKKRADIESARERLGREAGQELDTDKAMDARLRDRMRAIADMAQRLDEIEMQINQTVFRHELAHQVLFHIGLQRHEMKRRRWLQEGLATQFETPGALNEHRLADFLLIRWGAEEMSLRRLVTDAELLSSASAESAEVYAAAWGLVYYLIEKHPTDFSWYMATLASPNDEELEAGMDDVAIFERAFGPIDDAFEKRWRAYIQRLSRNR